MVMIFINFEKHVAVFMLLLLDYWFSMFLCKSLVLGVVHALYH
jgi:hypothetical protein